MRPGLKILLFVVGISLNVASATSTPIRSAGGYGIQPGITVLGPQTFTIDGNMFQQIIVCGGGNTEPASTTDCSLPLGSIATAGVFDLLVNLPTVQEGTVVDFGLPFVPTSQDFGLVVDCPGQFSGGPFVCTTPAPFDITCVNNAFSAPGSSMSFTVPACAAGGVTLFFEDVVSNPNAFATITLPGAATPEPSTISYLGIFLAPLIFLLRHRCNS
jgi:hypothetical protein